MTVSVTLHLGDCFDVMAAMEPNSVDSVITDAPYGLSFMGKDWDHGVPGLHFWEQALRLAKPGAMLLAFGGDRTHHRLMVAIEDAGWEIRTCIYWIFGSGFPKSLNLGKAIRKQYGAEAWDGWGTALKPAAEIIIVAMKPLDGTFAQNAEKWGVAGLNIEGGRIGTNKQVPASPSHTPFAKGASGFKPPDMSSDGWNSNSGRWPANLILDEDAAQMLDQQSGELSSGGYPPACGQRSQVATYGKPNERGEQRFTHNTGGASRFFYVAKASRAEREAGLEGMPERVQLRGDLTEEQTAYVMGELQRLGLA